MMTVAVFHGSPRKGNTYLAAKIFMDALSSRGDVAYTEFFFPKSLPVFCTGCQLCQSGPREKCPHAEYVTPMLTAILRADALIFTTPHYACDMSGSMKNLLDHLDFLTLTVAPRREIFGKKAFILTTGAGSAAAVKPMKRFLKNWGVNRVQSLGLRLFTDKWDGMRGGRRERCAQKLRAAARKFYQTKRGRPYLSALMMYHMSKFVLKRYVGKGNYPYEYWAENGYFKGRPF